MILNLNIEQDVDDYDDRYRVCSVTVAYPTVYGKEEFESHTSGK